MAAPEPQLPAPPAGEPLAGAVPSRLRAFAQRPAPWFALVALFAACYFGSYYRCGINFRDEGGTVTLLSERLLAGQRPFLDVQLGYNLMWFYPVVALFKWFGVSFVLLRGYCFALSTVTALTGFFCIQRVSRNPWLAALTSGLLVAAPGMTFKNYMPLMAVLNSFCLLQFALAGRQRLASGVRARTREGAHINAEIEPLRPAVAWVWLLLGSVALGLTLLTRIDVGMFFTFLWLFAIGICASDPDLSRRARCAQVCAGPLLLAAVVAAMHAPFVIDAHRRGFDRQFLAQYVEWPRGIISALSERVHTAVWQRLPRVSAPPAAGTGESALALPPSAAKHLLNRELLKRGGWEEFREEKSPEKKALILLIYAPLFSLVPLTLLALVRCRCAFRGRDSVGLRSALGALLVLGGALTVFPQYFFFRPDAPHLSEFSPGFWISVMAAAWLLELQRGSWKDWRTWFRHVFFLLLAAHAALFLWLVLHDRWTGTIAALQNRTELFCNDSGTVIVLVTKREQQGLAALVKVVHDHCGPGEYLVAYPYHPAVNLVVNRATYESNLYIDNATKSETWESAAIGRMEKFKPAVVVLSDWAINGTENSRFSAWAAGAKAWVQAHYDFQGMYMDREQFEVYTRRAEAPLLDEEAALSLPGSKQ